MTLDSSWPEQIQIFLSYTWENTNIYNIVLLLPRLNGSFFTKELKTHLLRCLQCSCSAKTSFLSIVLEYQGQSIYPQSIGLVLRHIAFSLGTNLPATFDHITPFGYNNCSSVADNFRLSRTGPSSMTNLPGLSYKLACFLSERGLVFVNTGIRLYHEGFLLCQNARTNQKSGAVWECMVFVDACLLQKAVRW